MKMKRMAALVLAGMTLAGGAVAVPKVKHMPTPKVTPAYKTRLKQQNSASGVTADADHGALKLVTVADDSMSPESNGMVTVTGCVTNNNHQTIPFVEIVINFLDNAGAPVDSGTADTQNLAAGGVWSFKITSLRKGITTYRIVKIIHQQTAQHEYVTDGIIR